MARTGSGGKRTPAKPAAVSGPGALSRRTDGAAQQAVGEYRAEEHGQRKALMEQKAGAPMFGQGGGGGTPPPPGPPQPPGSAFGPTQRPNEDPVVAQSMRHQGLGGQMAGILPPDPDATLRAIYAAFPHPDIAALLQRTN